MQTSLILRQRPPKSYKHIKVFMIFMILLKMSKHNYFHPISFFQIVGAWRDFTVVTKLIKNFNGGVVVLNFYFGKFVMIYGKHIRYVAFILRDIRRRMSCWALSEDFSSLSKEALPAVGSQQKTLSVGAILWRGANQIAEHVNWKTGNPIKSFILTFRISNDWMMTSK